jgi:excisionase family DNA binding protein
VTIKQAAEYYQLDPKTIRRMIAQGKLKARRVGERSIRVDRECLLELGRVKYWGT